MDNEFLSMMPAEVGIEPFSSRDAWGADSYGALVLYRCRVESKRRRVLNVKGEEVISEALLHLATVANISPADRVTMPSGFLPVHPPILTVHLISDENGPYYTEIYV